MSQQRPNQLLSAKRQKSGEKHWLVDCLEKQNHPGNLFNPVHHATSIDQKYQWTDHRSKTRLQYLLVQKCHHISRLSQNPQAEAKVSHHKSHPFSITPYQEMHLSIPTKCMRWDSEKKILLETLQTEIIKLKVFLQTAAVHFPADFTKSISEKECAFITSEGLLQ